MKIKSLRMKNFRCFKDTKIKFNERLTVLIGDNAAGKTATFNALQTPFYEIFTKLKVNVWGHGAVSDEFQLAHKQYVSIDTDLGKSIVPYFDSELFTNLSKIKNNLSLKSDEVMHIVRAFPAKRAVADEQIKMPILRANGSHRIEALDGCFADHWVYNEFLLWLYDRKYSELLRREKNPAHQNKLLRMVCKAVEKCLPGYVDLRVEIVNDVRTMLLTSELDEIDLSLHLKWQRRVLEDLLRVFPNTQFIVTTHSPLILTTAKPENIVYLKREDNNITAHYGTEMGIGTKGADAMRLMSYFMEVSSRPPEIKEQIRNYFLLIDAGKAELKGTKKERAKLEKTLGSDDPVFVSADAAIARKKRFAECAR